MDAAYLTHLLIEYRYWILFPLACFEGPLVSIAVGFAVGAGYFNPFIAYGILVLGDLIPDTGYYFVGRWGHRASFIKKYASKVGITEERFAIIERLWKKHPGKTMWTSKLAYGLSTPFLISSGLVDMPLQKFIYYALPITLIQYALLMTLGYFFGNSYTRIAGAFSGLETIIAAIVIGGGLYYLLTRFMREQLLQEEKEEEENK
jgi:membrane-associated protein